jgi:hypothetical protein
MKRTLILVLLSQIVSNVFAQGHVRFGFTTSPGITWLSPDNQNIKNEGVRFSFTYGAIVDFIIDDNELYSITSGVQIAMDGGKLSGMPATNMAGQSSMLTAKVQYLELPVGLKLRSNETSKNMTFYGILGIVNGINIRSRADYFYEGISESEELIKKEEKNVRLKDLPFYPNTIRKVVPYQLSLQFEGGTEFRVAENTSIVGGLYFRNGFTNIIDDKDKERIVGRNIGLRIAVMF